MSTKYNVEPPPTAKVILRTTAGDLEIELFGKQTPLTTRNFLQHCLDGYYDGTIFHRLVPGFVIQGGDPTGTGSGGESIYADTNGEKVAKPGEGGAFKDEFHSRLRFDRRGLLGMASEGKDGNGSQFFFTLGPAPELQSKNTMFGRVVGDTVYNLVKMGEAEVAEGGERPLYPEKVLSVEILINPFEGMEKRDIKAKRVAVEEKKEKPKPKRKAGKATLSFADEEEDFVPAAKKPKLGGATKEQNRGLQPRREPSPPNAKAPKQADPESDSEPEDEADKESLRRDKMLSETERQIAELKASMRRNGAAPAPKEEKKKSAFESLVPETASRGRQKKGSGNSALSLYNQFKSQLNSVPSSHTVDLDPEPEEDADDDDDANRAKPSNATAEDADENVCDLHFIPNCMSCAKWKEADEKEEEEEEEDWFHRKLTFARDRLGKDLEWRKKNEEISVIDPREKAKELGIKPLKRSGMAERERGIGTSTRDRERR